MNNKAHLTVQGINQIVNIKAYMNLGLSDKLKSEFPDNAPVARPAIISEVIANDSWVAGFVSGEGNFDVHITKSTNKTGYGVQMRFRFSQHKRDLNLMETLIRKFGAGKIYKYTDIPAVSVVISSFADISNIIIPFFKQNYLIGVKHPDYQALIKVRKLITEASHLTYEGLNLIREIKAGMNKGIIEYLSWHIQV